MGKKELLRSTTITDTTNAAFNGSGLNIINTVYDVSTDQVEVYNLPFSAIGPTSEGYLLSEGELNDAAFPLKQIDVRYTQKSDDFIDAYPSLKNNRLYCINGNTNGVDVVNIFNGEEVSSFDTDLTTPIRIILNDAETKAYILDSSDSKIYVFDISNPSSISRLSDEDITTASSPIDFDIYDGVAYVVLSTGNTLYKYTLSTGASAGTFTLVKAFNYSISISEEKDRIYVSSADLGGTNREVSVYGLSDESNKSTEDFAPTNLGGRANVEGNFVYVQIVQDLLGTDYNYIECYDISTPTSVTEATARQVGSISDEKDLLRVQNGLLFADDAGDFELYMCAIFPNALVHKRQKDVVNPFIGPFWRSKLTDFGFQDGTNYTYFTANPSPPYVYKKTIPLNEANGTDVTSPTNLTLSIKNFSEPTGKRAQDGSITVLARGGTAPYTYYILGNNGFIENARSSPTFSNLNPGNYIFKVTDANDVSYVLQPYTLFYRSTTFDNYGLIYTHRFNDIQGNLYHKIEIFDRDSSDNNTNIDAASMPVNYSIEAQGEDIYDLSILPASLNVSLIAETLEAYIDFSTADDERYAVVWSIDDGGGTFNERWRGYLLPESYSQQYGSVPVNVGFTFTDRLGDLKNIPYANRNTFQLNKGFTGGTKSQLDILLFCFKQLNMDMDGVRIACDWFEDNHTTTSTETPFEQTYIDTDSYFQRDDETLAITDAWTLEQVVKSILEPYSCSLITWAGYYWIYKQKDYLDHTSFSYVEFDMDGTQQSTGTQTNYVDFGTAQGSNRWRWRGGKQSLTTTRIYRDVELTLNSVIREQGLTVPFVGNYAYNYYALSAGFSGFHLIRGNDFNCYITDYNRQKQISPFKEEKKLIWNFDLIASSIADLTFADNSNSSTKIETAGDITYSGSDTLTLKLGIETWIRQGDYVFGVLGENWPYIRLRWRLKLGQYYYNSQEESWSLNTSTNEYFLNDRYNEKVDVEYEVPLRDVSGSTEQYTLTVFVPSFMEYDIEGADQSAMITAIKAVPTAGVARGQRLVTRHETTQGGDLANRYLYYFYELTPGLATGTEPDVIEPTDYDVSTNPNRWNLAAIKISSNSNITHSGFYNIDLLFNPNGTEIPKNFTLNKAGDTRNKVTLERELNHFDAPPGINNPLGLYYNVLQTDTIGGNYISTEPTNLWNETGGVSRRIQDHRLDWLVRLSKQGRYRISGAVDYNTEILPFQCLRVPDEDNRRFIINGGSWNLKENQIEGEFVEIGTDTPPTLVSKDSSADSSAGE